MSVVAWWRSLIEKSLRYGADINSHDVWKFIAIVIMTIDHIGYYFYPDCLWLRAIGRITFPVWFFFAGYSQSRMVGKEILLLALLMVPVNVLTYHGVFPLNALFSIILCQQTVRWLNRHGWIETAIYEILAACLFLAPFTTSLFEYGTQGVAFAVMGDMVRRGLTARRYQVFFLGAIILFLGMQQMVFAFTPAQLVFVIVGSCGVVFGLSRFSIRVFFAQWREDWVKSSIRFLARNSLYYYFIHRIGLEIISWFLVPHKGEMLRWF